MKDYKIDFKIDYNLNKILQSFLSLVDVANTTVVALLFALFKPCVKLSEQIINVKIKFMVNL